MRCLNCGTENPDGMRFCTQCASPLVNRCPQCGFENPPGARFCGQCAAALGGQPLATAPGPRPAPTPEAERRQITVLFCDLVGSTALSADLDPEDLREVVRNYQAVCAEGIGRFDGHIAQYLGDGVLAYFGHPVAHEDDAQRAVRAALHIVAEMRQLNARLERERGLDLAVRVGIHTGMVVVGDMGGGERREQLALGETPNVAARVQGLAEPGAVLISAATYRLVQGFFTCQDLGAQNVRGLAQPLQLYQVLADRGVQSRMDVAASTGMTPLVGRDQEIALLLERWQRAKDGYGQVVLVHGEPGIGKSRQMLILKERLAAEAHTELEGRCSSYYQNTAFYAVTDALQRLLQFQADDGPEAKLAKLEAALGRQGFDPAETVPLFATLLSLPLTPAYQPLGLSPQRQRQRTLETMLAWLRRAAARQPVLFIIEDLHWADPSTLDLLDLIISQAPSMPVLALLTFRSEEFRPPWAADGQVTELSLARLPQEETAVLATRVAGGKMLPAEVLRQVVARTDGVPLFVEELTKMVLESGLVHETSDRFELAGPLPPLAIPATVQDSLMARLDRLATTKMVAQLGATLGREFRYEVLEAIANLDERSLRRDLGRLVESGLVFQQGRPPEATYTFKHALVQDAAYQSLLRSTRQQYHQRIAQVLAERFPETAQTQPELLAEHYARAGLNQQAVDYWYQAGQRASERSADLEAIAHLTQALEHLKALPESPERIGQELTLQLTIGPAYMATKGYAGVEVERAFSRARALCLQLGETPQIGPVLFGLWTFYVVRSQLQTAHEVADQLSELAQRLQDPDLLLEAHQALGWSFWFEGQPAQAREHLERVVAQYDPDRHRGHAFMYGQEPGMAGHGCLAAALWQLGYPDQAVVHSRASLQALSGLTHHNSTAFAHTVAAYLHVYRREARRAQELAEIDIRVSQEQGLRYFLGFGMVLHGWAVFQQGQLIEGISEMREGLGIFEGTGAEIFLPFFRALLAEALGATGQMDEALALLAEARACATRNGEAWWEPELYRVRGELLLQRAAGRNGALEGLAEAPELSEAEACFRTAVANADSRRIKTLHLRAVTSLCRLWQRQGKRDEARTLLAESVEWFTEGFETLDLTEARALLAELGAA